MFCHIPLYTRNMTKKTSSAPAIKKKSPVVRSKKKPLPPIERMEKGRRATREQSDKILEETAKLIADLHTRRYIQQFLAKRWGISGSQADEYMMRARRLYKNELPNPQQAAADLLEKLLDAEKAYRGRGMSHLIALKQIRELLVPQKHIFGGDPDGAPIKTEQVGPILSPATIIKAAEILKSVGAVTEDDSSNPAK